MGLHHTVHGTLPDRIGPHPTYHGARCLSRAKGNQMSGQDIGLLVWTLGELSTGEAYKKGDLALSFSIRPSEHWGSNEKMSRERFYAFLVLLEEGPSVPRQHLVSASVGEEIETMKTWGLFRFFVKLSSSSFNCRLILLLVPHRQLGVACLTD
ncbi:hypothetical protein L6452_26237 [Arctium lappa]|uniref:Uncharacterized protein n=1 Tax=Arctium lappa TaxID=4217 RepID=A0ACB9ACZ9_ARCLA|nr:hypothetical protein L6452_26237 [Arctium lappa]